MVCYYVSDFVCVERDFWTASWGHIKIWAGERAWSASTWDSTDVCRISAYKWTENSWAFQVFQTCCIATLHRYWWVASTFLFCRMTNYELLRWLVETRSCDVGHNRTLHSWASDRATFSHSITHVARLFPKLAENENRTNTSNLWWVDLYWDNARMRMYGHDVQSINELFVAERNTN